MATSRLTPIQSAMTLPLVRVLTVTCDTSVTCVFLLPVNDTSCSSCLPYGTDRPSEKQFLYYLPWFLDDNPTATCATGGHAAYASAVVLNKTDNSVISECVNLIGQQQSHDLSCQ